MTAPGSPSPTAWIEVRRGALAHNLRQVRGLLAPGVRLCAVVKAAAYGHGPVEPARIFAAEGTDFLAVTTMEEGIALREAGLTLPILVFVPPLPDQADAFLEHALDATVSQPGQLDALAAAAERAGRQARVHLKVDTGMGRFGGDPAELSALLTQAAGRERLEIVGVYTHFASAFAPDPAPTRRQLDAFRRAGDSLPSGGAVLRHAANSAAALTLPESHLDMVRVGTLLYGQYPMARPPRRLDLRETWSLKARLVQVREVPAGTPVGYGGEWTARRRSRLAVLPVGYADGLTVAPESVFARRALATWLAWRVRPERLQPAVAVRGKRCPVVGRVAMQTCVVDVTDVPDVAAGDEAIVPCRRLQASARLPIIYV